MGSLCSCFRAPEPDDESIDSDDNEQIQDSSGMVNRTVQAHFTSFLQNLTNKVSFCRLDHFNVVQVPLGDN